MPVHRTRKAIWSRRATLSLALAIAVSSVLVPLVYAASWNASATTSCSGSWSLFSWSGANLWDWGRTTAWHWYYSDALGGWVQVGSKDSGQVFGESGDLTPFATPVEYHHNLYYQGTGGSVSSFFSGQESRYGDSMFCQ